MDRYQAYSEYKISGIDWLGEIPKHWIATRIKHIGMLKGGAGFPHDEQGVTDQELDLHKVNALGKTGSEGFLEKSENTISLETAKKLGAFVFPEKSIVFAKVGAALLLGRIRWLKYPSCLDNNMMGLVVRSIYDSRYIKHAMSTVKFDYVVNPGAIPSLNESQMGSLFLGIPTLLEQTIIANFLDHETAKIDTLIEKQQQLIQLLKEKRQAVISHAVTKGLNPNAPMKDSGVEWLGKVPEHWVVARLKNVLKINNGRDYKDVEVEDGGYPVYGSGGIFKRSSSFLLDGQSVLFGRKGTVDKPLLVSGKFWTVDTMFYSEIFNKCIPEFIHYQSMQFPFDLLSTSTALPSMTQEALSSLGFVYPSKNEQNEIVEFIQIESDKMDAVICKANEAIQLMQERRTALISAAVTGKIDVRGFSVDNKQMTT